MLTVVIGDWSGRGDSTRARQVPREAVAAAPDESHEPARARASTPPLAPMEPPRFGFWSGRAGSVDHRERRADGKRLPFLRDDFRDPSRAGRRNFSINFVGRDLA